MNLKQDHNKLKNDITLADNRIKELDSTKKILYDAINDILKEKRRIDKYSMELDDKIKDVATDFEKK